MECPGIMSPSFKVACKVPPRSCRSYQLPALCLLLSSSPSTFMLALLQNQNIFGDSALCASLLFTKPPISLLQDAAWIPPITSSLDV